MDSHAPAPADQPLSKSEELRLTFWKWRYALEALGFTPYQASRLTLLTYLRASGRC